MALPILYKIYIHMTVRNKICFICWTCGVRKPLPYCPWLKNKAYSVAYIVDLFNLLNLSLCQLVLLHIVIMNFSEPFLRGTIVV